MEITIIGTGKMARAIGTRAVMGGNSVTLVGRDPQKAQALAAELQGVAQKGARAQVASLDSPLRGEMVILALFYTAVGEVIRHYGKQLAGKIVVEITNPLNATFDDLALPSNTSAAEEIAKLLPAGARLVKAFNTTFASTVVAGQVAGQPVDVLIAGDDSGAKQAVAQLVEAGGMRPIDAGPLKRARQLEGMGLLLMALQPALGMQYRGGWTMLS